MRGFLVILFVVAAFGATAAYAQTAATTSAPKVKAVQPGLLEVTDSRVNEVVAAGITSITATPGKGRRSIYVESAWGASYFGFPKGVPQVAFRITTGGAGGTATISAPGFTQANQGDYRTTIEAIVPYAIERTNQDRRLTEGSGR